jgi:hypothetical protein
VTNLRLAERFASQCVAAIGHRSRYGYVVPRAVKGRAERLLAWARRRG